MDNIVKLCLFCALAVVVLQAWKLLNWVWFRPKKMEKLLREQGFKGNSYKFLFGDFKEMVAMVIEAKSRPISPSDDIVPRVVPFLHKSVNTYGKKFFIWLGPRPMVHIMDPELVKDILTKFSQFQKPRGGNPLGRLLARGLLFYEGDKWVKHRKIVNPAFHAEKLKNMLPAFHLSCSELISKWEKMMSEEGSCELDVWPDLQTLSGDVISRTAFGSSYQEGRRIFELQKEQTELLFQTTQALYIPGSQYLPSKKNKRMKAVAREVKESIRRIINKRLMAMKAGETNNEDLLAILLESNQQEIELYESDNHGMTIDEVIEECKLFYFAGQETTANLLVWTMILLSLHPSWQAQAREEVIQLFGKKTPNIEGLNHLKIVSMILHEVLRLYPPGLNLGRMVHEETKLGEITLPARTFISVPIMMIHHDRELWGDDVKEFKPDRFSEGVSKATKGLLSYFPFSWGPRICIGQNFAMLEAKMAVAMILQKFSFVISPSYSHAPHSIITLKPQHGAHLILQKMG